MKSNVRFLALPAALLALAALPTVAHARRTPNIAAASNAFGIGLLGKLVQAKPDENCFISPYSIQQALLLTDNGASGSTKAQIERVLHLESLTLPEINAQSKALRTSLIGSDPQVKISIANALWADRSYKFSESYQETCRRFYDAEVRTVALHTAAGEGAINGWVSQHTEGKIKNIVSQYDLADAIAVLTNAVYFHGTWTEPFPKANTHAAPFYVTPQASKPIPTMSRLGAIDYVKSGSYEAVALPYGGGRLRMVAVLPSANTSLNTLIASLTPDQWATLSTHLKPTRLQLFLPRVHTSYKSRLRHALTELGMGDAFGGKANLHAAGLGSANISEVIHKTTLDIDEEGSTASAATAVVIARSILLPPTQTVRIDRPFFCAIQDTKTGLVLFAGAIRNPTE